MKHTNNFELGEDAEKFAQDLRQLFLRAHEDLPGDGFELRVAASVQRQRRVRNSLRVVLFCLLVVVAVISAPLLIEASMVLGRLMENFYGDVGALLTSPLGWAASLLLAAWTLRKSRLA